MISCVVCGFHSVVIEHYEVLKLEAGLTKYR